MSKSKFRKRLAVVAVIIILLLSAVLGVTIAYFQDHSDVVRNTFVGGALFNEPEVEFVLHESEKREVTTNDGDLYKWAKYTLYDCTCKDNVNGKALTEQTYTVLPGVPIPKDPHIVIGNLLMDAYLFVEVINDGNGDFQLSNGVWTSTKETGITWSMASGWQLLASEQQPTNGNKIYYYKGTAADGALDADVYNTEANLPIQIMNQSHVTVNGKDYAVEVKSTYTGKQNTEVVVKFKAYICQADGDNRRLTYGDAWDSISPYKKVGTTTTNN